MNIATAYVEIRTDSSKAKAGARAEAKKIAAAAGTAGMVQVSRPGPRDV